MLSFVVNKKELKQKISTVADSVGNRTFLPILQSILFTPENDKIRIYGTNLQTSAVAWLNVGEYDGEESFAVYGELLDDIVKNLSDNEIIFEYSDGVVVIRDGKTKYKLSTVADTERLPVRTYGENSRKFSIETSILLEMLKRVSFSAAVDNAMASLNGVYWEFSNNTLRLAASDGYRLAYAEEPLENANDLDFILPLKSIKLIENLLSSSAVPATEIICEPSTVTFKLDDIAVTISTVEENFPDYKKVIPKTFKTEAVIKNNELQEALKRIMVACKHGIEKVRFTIKDDTLELSNVSSSTVEAFESIEIEKTGENMVIHFNPRFLYDALKHCDAKLVEFKFVDTLDPLLIKPKETNNYFFITLPLRA